MYKSNGAALLVLDSVYSLQKKKKYFICLTVKRLTLCRRGLI